MTLNRIRLRIASQSGAGLLSVGTIVIHALRDLGFFVVADREFPSLIKGGHSCFNINFSETPIRALSKGGDILVTIDKPSLRAYFDDLREGGIWIHGYERPVGLKDFRAKAEERGIETVYLPTRTTAKAAGGTDLQQNVVLTGMVWKVLGLPLEPLERCLRKQFAKKPQFMESNRAALRAGYERTTCKNSKFQVSNSRESMDPHLRGEEKMLSGNNKRILIDGHRALTLGAIEGGVRAYYAYPMSPSTHILEYMAEYARETGIVVKQGEDEITVANLALGSWYAGTRALCATSGGGYDLMTETVSLAAMIEIPWVCVLVQRPGPATGLPTWTGQGDLHLAVYSSHGEFARLVIGVSDPEDSFALIQHALNYAEKYQIPVIVLSDKNVAESLLTIDKLELGAIPIERHLVSGKALEKLTAYDRYAITESGISPRWIPLSDSEKYYFTNGDEHDASGRLDESENTAEMYAKRIRKLETLEAEIPHPEVYGVQKGADISFIGWGSTKAVMRDAIEKFQCSSTKSQIKVNYLHFSYLFPLKTERLEQFFKENKNVHLIEGNHNGQLGQMIEQKTALKFKGKLLKWNGRPFFVEDVEGYILKNAKFQ